MTEPGRPEGDEPTSTPPLRPIPPGRYRDFLPVGEGGMGVVYLALDTELNRRVAMKIVRPSDVARESGPPHTPFEMRPPRAGTEASASFEEVRERFLREAVVTGHMEHPGIVPVYEIGETETGVPYYTMRFVRGKRTLRSAIDEAKTSEARLDLLEPFLKVCDTLAYAHARGVLHRDLKPENVALGEFGEVVVLDWGLAKVHGHADPARKETLHRLDLRSKGSETLPGVLGTPGYLSPESARGDVEAIDARSDVYSLGVLLYECLTGRLPFDPKELVPYLMRLASEPAPDPRTVAPSVPAGLAAICMAALERDRDARLATAAELAARVRAWEHATAVDREIEAWLSEAETAMEGAEKLRGEALLRQADRAAASASKALDRRPDDARGRAVLTKATALRERGIVERETSARNRTLKRTGIAVLAVAVAAAVVVGAFLDEKRREAEASADRARTAEALARDEKARADQERDAAKAARAQAETARTQAEGERRKAEDATAVATSRLERLNDVHNFLLFELRDRLLPLGKLDVLENVAKKTLEATADADLEAASDDMLRNRSVALDILGDVRVSRDDAEGAIEAYRSALALTETLAKRHPESVVYQRDLTIDRARIGDMHERSGDYDAALAEYRAALDIVRALRTREPDVAQWKNDLAVNLNYVGNVLLNQAKPEEALAAHREALEIRRALLVEHPGDAAWRRELAVTLNLLGNVERTLGDSKAALASYREALVEQERVAASDPGNVRFRHDLSVFWRNLGRVLRETGDGAGALEAYRASLAIMRALAGADPAHAGWRNDLLISLDAVAGVLADLERFDEAVETHREALALRRKSAAESPERPALRAAVAEALGALAELHRRREDHAASLAAHQEMLAIYARAAEEHADEPTWKRLASVAYNEMGDDFLAAGDREKAAGAHRASLGLIEPLAAGAPDNDLWQTDVAVTGWKLAHALEPTPPGKAEARAALEKGLQILRRLKAQGRLPADKEPWIPDFEKALAEVAGG